MPNFPLRMLMVADATCSSGVLERAPRPAVNRAVDNFIYKASRCEHLRPHIGVSTFQPERYANVQRAIVCLASIRAATP